MELLGFAVLVVLSSVLIWNIRAIRLRLDTLAKSRSDVLDSHEVESILELELQRARRLNYPLSVINLRLLKQGSTHPSPHDVLALIESNSRTALSGDLRAGVTNILQNSDDPVVKLRSTDLAVYDKKHNRFLMMLVGTTKNDAERVAKHVATSLSERLGYSSYYGCAEFPGDHYFAEDLISGTEAERHAIDVPKSKNTFAA